MDTTDETRGIKQSARKGLADSVLGTRNLMMVAALAVVGLIILVPLNYLAPAVGASPNAVWIGCALLGLWVIPYLLPAAVVRRPGATLLASLIVGIISVFITPVGPMAIVGNVLGGLFIEVPLALMLYRFWTWWAYMIAASVFGLLNGLMYLLLLKTAVGLSVSLPVVVTGVASSILGALAVVGITRLLHRAGVGMDHRA